MMLKGFFLGLVLVCCLQPVEAQRDANPNRGSGNNNANNSNNNGPRTNNWPGDNYRIRRQEQREFDRFFTPGYDISEPWFPESNYNRPSKRPGNEAELSLDMTKWRNTFGKYVVSSHIANTPFEGIEVPAIRFNVDAQKGGRFDLPTGTTVSVPPRAFADKNGAPIESGEVEMTYRELHDAADIIAAGIPLHDTINGQFLETGGMFELNARQGGEAVRLREYKAVTVQMPSYNPGNDFDFWTFDARNNHWYETDGNGQPQPMLLSPTRAQEIARNNNRSEPPSAIRSFSVPVFGLHNWDRLTSLTGENARSPRVDFAFDEQAPSDCTALPFYWIGRNGRAVVRMNYVQARTVGFVPRSSDLLAVVFPGNRVAVFTGADFDKLNRHELNLTYTFRTIAQPVSSVAEFARVLGIRR